MSQGKTTPKSEAPEAGSLSFRQRAIASLDTVILRLWFAVYKPKKRRSEKLVDAAQSLNRAGVLLLDLKKEGKITQEDYETLFESIHVGITSVAKELRNK